MYRCMGRGAAVDQFMVIQIKSAFLSRDKHVLTMSTALDR